jgi:hypothetical protein
MVSKTRLDVSLDQRFPNFYVCDPKVANVVWPVILPYKRQQSVIFTIEHYMILPLIKKY